MKPLLLRSVLATLAAAAPLLNFLLLLLLNYNLSPLLREILIVFFNIYLVSWAGQRGRTSEALLGYTAKASCAAQGTHCPFAPTRHPQQSVCMKFTSRFIPDDIGVACLHIVKINV